MRFGFLMVCLVVVCFGLALRAKACDGPFCPLLASGQNAASESIACSSCGQVQDLPKACSPEASCSNCGPAANTCCKKRPLVKFLKFIVGHERRKARRG